jgi:acyl dehydratase
LTADADLLDLVGTSTDFERSWTADDTLLFAVAVGAGRDPLRDLAYVTENSSGVDQRVLPAFAVLINQVQLPTKLRFTGPKGSVMYAGQQVEQVSPIPPAGHAHVHAEVAEVLDKGKGAIVRVATESVDVASGSVIARTTCSYFLRGRGGFGGPRGTTDVPGVPDRRPDRVLEVETRPEQALVYRLTGDRNPLHSDPVLAERAGFARPILHGMCTYGMASLELAAAFADAHASDFTSMTARFVAPTLPGDALRILCWENGPEIAFRVDVRDESRVVLDDGRFVLSRHEGPRENERQQ